MLFGFTLLAADWAKLMLSSTISYTTEIQVHKAAIHLRDHIRGMGADLRLGGAVTRSPPTATARVRVLAAAWV